MKHALCLLLVVSVAACGDDPTAPTRAVVLCSSRTWLAYQNEGAQWTRAAGSNGRFSFPATERLGVAVFNGNLDYPILEVGYLTSEQAAKTFSCPAATSPVKTLRGAAQGLKPDEEAHIRYGPSIASASATFPTFTISIPDGPLDLVATRVLPYSTSAPEILIDRVVIRRGENRADGSMLPLLNFDSTEAFAPQPNVLTVVGAPANQLIGAQTDFATQSGTVNPLGAGPLKNGMTTTYSVPASRQVAGDVHLLDIGTADRRVLFVYAIPSDRTLALGPEPSAPIFTTETNSPTLRIRAEVTGQSEYGSSITLRYGQAPPATTNRNSVSVSATKEYFGATPATWSLTIPDLSGVDGFQPSWGLQPGPYAWSMHVHSWPFGFSARTAQDGQTLRAAFTYGPR